MDQELNPYVHELLDSYREVGGLFKTGGPEWSI
jgi:hypothetical protein